MAIPTAFGSLRRILDAVASAAPKVVQGVAATDPASWNRLFPGAFKDAPDLTDIALTPSERRLHRESEQVFRILSLAARAVQAGLEESKKTLVVRQAGAADLVSLRGLMRALEWNRLSPTPIDIRFEGFDVRAAEGSEAFEPRRRRFVQSLCRRLRIAEPSMQSVSVAKVKADAPVDLEGRYLALVADPKAPLSQRLAASVLGTRACFFTTNYEGAMLAADLGLDLLTRHGASVDKAAVLAAWDELDNGFTTAAIEVDRDNIGDADELRALLLRCVGVVHSFCGENDDAMSAFGRALECRIPPEWKGQLRMFRALSLIKRMGQLPNARAEAEAGIEALSGGHTDDRALHEAWLRNVLALTYFQEKRLDDAVAQEMRAIRCVGSLHSASATHLKVNLITNLSVIQESAKKFEEATATWRKFEKMQGNWDVNFHKHHRYRLAALNRMAGNVEEAVVRYGESYRSATELDDAFHQQVIASDLGYTLLDQGKREEAATWYDRAVEHARAGGDPFRMAEGMAGAEIARNGKSFSEAAKHAAMSSTFEAEATKLAQACGTGDAAAVRPLLARPRNKLNRPFDLVNLY